MKQQKNGTTFLLIGILLILFALGAFFYYRNFQESALEASAEIISIQEDHSGEDVVYRATVRFETAAGDAIVTQLDHGSSSLELGDRLTVLYDPEDPSTIRTESSGLVVPLVSGAFGAVFVLLGAASILKRKKQPA